ncbi:MAG: diaminobutyrate acetyltransferase [Methylobacter sp.]
MSQTLELRSPKSEDGISVFQLVAQCPPLDPNSVYCNLLQCTHFADTSVAALNQGQLIGFVSAYLLPDRTDTLFIWQVAVSENARGQGLATQMLRHALNRPNNAHVCYVETTITPSNQASWALFERLAEKFNAELCSSALFDKEKHFDGRHDSEMLVKIGPLKRNRDGLVITHDLATVEPLRRH